MGNGVDEHLRLCRVDVNNQLAEVIEQVKRVGEALSDERAAADQRAADERLTFLVDGKTFTHCSMASIDVLRAMRAIPLKIDDRGKLIAYGPRCLAWVGEALEAEWKRRLEEEKP
jgi:hypothetical protein